jgi:hypothetical protein
VRSSVCRVQDPSSGRHLEARVEEMGEDLVVAPPHKEEPIARGIAVKLAEALGRVTVVTAGVHDDDLDAEGVACYLRLGNELGEELARRLA